jgi:hypothetical protein
VYTGIVYFDSRLRSKVRVNLLFNSLFKLKMPVFWVVEVLAASIISAMMTEAVRASEMLVNFYQTTWHYNPEDSHLRTHRRENLKSYIF